LGLEVGRREDVAIQVSDAVSFDGVGSNGFSSGVFSNVESGAVGNGGSINLTAGSLSVTDGAQVSASTFGLGNAGNLNVRALESELIGTSPDGQFTSGLRSAVEVGAVGNGGNLTVQTGQLTVRDGAQVSAGTFGEGPSGNLEVRASDLVELIGTSAVSQFPSGLYTQVFPGATGDGGNLTVETGRLSVQDGAQVSAGTFGEGSSGTLEVSYADLPDGAELSFAAGNETVLAALHAWFDAQVNDHGDQATEGG
jgi:large exoprotein involved in heme utilization and adhesion